MRLRPTSAAALLAVAFVVATGSTSIAGTAPSDKARRSAVVAKVGPREITAGEVEDRLSIVPRFQLLAMGTDAADIRRKFLADVVIPEALVAAEAEKEHLDQDLVVQNDIKRSLAQATMRVIRAKVGGINQITRDDIKKYYADNRSRFDTPVRYSVWRILCAKKEEAQSVLDAAKQSPTMENFARLAREHSIDKATDLRGGNLGVVDLDGNSSETGLKVEPAIVKAASSVKDGEIVPQPVPEGPGFSVVWHRGTVPPAHRTIEEAAAQIREVLYQQRKDEAVKAEIDRLRHERLTESNENVLNAIEISTVDGQVIPRRRPGQVPPMHQVGRAAPKP